MLECRYMFLKRILKKSSAKIRCFRTCKTFFSQFVILLTVIYSHKANLLILSNC